MPSPALSVRRRLFTWAPHLLALALFAVYCTWSLNRHERLRTGGFDLGIFEQAIRAYAELRAPVAELKAPGFNLLGDHFHPILMLIAPFYRVFPDPATILVAQAFLIAVSAVPITRLAVAKTGVPGGIGIGLAYGLSWGLQAAVDFDFHEVAFAVPMIAFSLVAIVEERWRAAVLWAAPLVLVKEDLPVTLAAIGLVIVLRGQRRLGAAVIGFAVAAGLLILTVLIPAFSPTGSYGYSISQVPTDQGPLRRFFAPAEKWHTLLWLLIPTVFLAPFSSLLIVAAPTLLWRFWSTNPLYWGMGFQYSAILMPIVFVAFVEALGKLGVRRKWAFSAVAVTIAVAATFVTPWPLKHLLNGRNWQISQTVRETRSLLAMIPDGSVVAADNHLAPQLTARSTVFLFPSYPGYGVDPEWVVYSTAFDTSMAAAVSVEAEIKSIQGRYAVVASNSSAVLLRLRTGP